MIGSSALGLGLGVLGSAARAAARTAAVTLLVALLIPIAIAPGGAAVRAAGDVLAILRPAPLSDAEAAARIDSAIRASADAGRFNGAVLVARDGRVVLSRGYGLADAARGVPNQPSTRFLIGSLTKQFVATAILRLQAQGRLAVGDPVCRHVPDCPPHWRDITIHHLLTHTSGLPIYTGAPALRELFLADTETGAYLSWLRSRPLAAPPGTRYTYNNSGYLLLGHVVEGVTGVPLEDYLEAEFFRPLGMADTGFARHAILPEGGALGHGGKNRPEAPHLPYTHLSGVLAAGGMHSTVEDLYRWDHALYGDAVLPAHLKQLMLTPGTDSSGYSDGYGYGWWIERRHGRRVVTHGGAINGFRSEMERYPDQRVTVIMLTNDDFRGWMVSPGPRLMKTMATLLLR